MDFSRQKENKLKTRIKISQLLTEIWKPKRVAFAHCKGHHKIKEAFLIPPVMELTLLSAHNVLSISSSDVASDYWLCLKYVPPFYYGIPIYAFLQKGSHKYKNSGPILASLIDYRNVTYVLPTYIPAMLLCVCTIHYPGKRLTSPNNTHFSCPDGIKACLDNTQKGTCDLCIILPQVQAYKGEEGISVLALMLSY